MNLEIQWFIYALVSNQLISVEDCMQIYEQLGTPDLGTYAQTLLNTHGFHLKVDGIFGMLTESAVLEYQALNKLKADGII